MLLSLHSSVVGTIGLSPAYMVFHRELRLPWLAELRFNTANYDKMLTDLLDTMKMTDNLIKDNILKSFEQADEQYNKKAQTRKFEFKSTSKAVSEYPTPLSILIVGKTL